MLMLTVIWSGEMERQAIEAQRIYNPPPILDTRKPGSGRKGGNATGLVLAELRQLKMWMTAAHLAERLNYGKRQVNYALQLLKNQQLVEVMEERYQSRGGKRSWLYKAK